MMPSTTLAAAESGATETILSGPLVLAAPLAFAAGAVSFASPCCLPLVPGYLSYLTGLVGAETTESSSSVMIRTRVRSRVVAASVLFVLGFTVIFTAQTVAVLGLSRALLVNNDVLMRIGGVVTLIMGLVMLGFIKPLQRERRIHVRPTGRVFGATLLGAAFGFGWVVCIGPTLAGVVALATATDWGGSAWRGLLLVLVYCLGLGLPFVMLAFGFGWATHMLGFLRRHSRALQVTGAGLMMALGVLMVTGVWGDIVAWLRVALGGTTTVLL